MSPPEKRTLESECTSIPDKKKIKCTSEQQQTEVQILQEASEAIKSVVSNCKSKESVPSVDSFCEYIKAELRSIKYEALIDDAKNEIMKIILETKRKSREHEKNRKEDDMT